MHTAKLVHGPFNPRNLERELHQPSQGSETPTVSVLSDPLAVMGRVALMSGYTEVLETIRSIEGVEEFICPAEAPYINQAEVPKSEVDRIYSKEDSREELTYFKTLSLVLTSPNRAVVRANLDNNSYQSTIRERNKLATYHRGIITSSLGGPVFRIGIIFGEVLFGEDADKSFVDEWTRRILNRATSPQKDTRGKKLLFSALRKM